MDAFELMGKVSRKGGGVGGGREGRGGRGRGCAERLRGGCVRAVACEGVACVPWRAWGLRACRGVRGGSRACRGREPPERLLRDTAASEHG